MKRMRFFCGLIVMVLAIGMVMAGCVTAIIPQEGVCDKIPEGSYSVICQIAEKMGTTPETMAGLLKVGNLAGLATSAYDANQASAFIEDLKTFLENSKAQGLAYAAVLEYAQGKYAKLPLQVQASLTLIETVGGVQIAGMGDTLLSDYDYELLIGHLDDQLKLLAPYLGDGEPDDGSQNDKTVMTA